MLKNPERQLVHTPRVAVVQLSEGLGIPGGHPAHRGAVGNPVFGRPIGAEEAEHAGAFLEDRVAASGGRRGGSPEESALAELCLALFNANEFVYVD